MVTMADLEDLGIDGIKGIIFDCYRTLIDIETDEDSMRTWETLSKWLIYQGVKISPEDLKENYKREVKDYFNTRWETYPEVDVAHIFCSICQSHAIWQSKLESLGEEAARTFRAGSLRRLQAFPQSIRLLKKFEDYPKAIVSNGQRVFSEQEVRYFGYYDLFNVVLFSSDFGHKKPDPRIFLEAAKRLGLQSEEILCIGDNFENDIIPATKLGMKAMHIEEAWRLFKTE
jgi:putative hydrolase of the HAD superfamily